MDIQSYWEKALKNTEIVRPRVQALSTFDVTQVPYIFLAESGINPRDTVVRRGEAFVKQPSIILPPNIPQFKGFEFDRNAASDESVVNFLLVRGVSIPSMKYDNKTYALDVFEGKLKAATQHFLEQLQVKEDVHTGLMVGPEDCWQFSILIFIYTQVIKNASQDIQRLWDEYKRKNFRH